MRQRDRDTEIQRDRETERQRDRETERQRDRETDRQRETKRDRELISLYWVCLIYIIKKIKEQYRVALSRIISKIDNLLLRNFVTLSYF